MDAEVVVVGGGIVGLWTAHTLVSQGVKTILIEQYPYPHTRGSSHGQSRITRTAYSEEMYSAMMPEANRKWKELKEESGVELFVKTGLLTVYDVKMQDSFNAMQSNMKKYEPDHEIVRGEDLGARFPGIVATSNQVAIYDRNAGLLRADACLLALQRAFKNKGGILRERERVSAIHYVSDQEVEVRTQTKTYRARSVVLTCGTYINEILATLDLKLPVKATRQMVFYWRDRSGWKYSSANKFPEVILLKDGQFDHLYSMPCCEYPGLTKICYYTPGPVIEPHRRDQVSSEGRRVEQRLQDWLKTEINTIFTDVDTTSPAISEVCMKTVSPDLNFILDYHPKYKNIVIGSGFSGHGFKTSPSVGHILANMAQGLQSTYPLHPFRLDRFEISSKL